MKISFANGSLGAWLTKVIDALRNWNRVQVTHTEFSMRDVPQITSGWDYRPRDVIRRDRAFDCRGAGTAEVGSSASAPNENDNVWFNFTNSDPTPDKPTTKAPLSGDACKVLEYDQSPIDNLTDVFE